MSLLAAHSTLSKVAEIDAHEGPVYVADEDALYFTTLPRDLHVAIKRLSLVTGTVEIVRTEANMANGMTLATDGRLLVCEQGTHVTRAQIAAVDRATGHAETLLDAPFGLPLNSPNDVVVKSDGTIWFTDPTYGFLQGFRPPPSHGDFVWRFDPATGRAAVVASDFDKPNGLAFSPDERTLYIGDSGANHEAGSFDPQRPHHIRAFDVAGSRLVNDRLFAVTTPGFPDGIKVDADGRVYASSFAGVQIFDETGELIDEIDLPGAVNFTFGGPARNTLLITTDTALWAWKGA
jgi:gluconolactonase